MSQRSAFTAAAMATALVSEPPRPSVAMRLSGPDALETGDDRHLADLEPLDQRRAVDLLDARGAMRIVGLDRDLPALPGARVDADRLQHERQQPRRHLLARGDHGVVLPGIVDVEVGALGLRRFPDPADQLVGLAGHGRDDDGDLMAGIDLAFDMARDVADAADVGHGRSAEFHHDARHGKRVSRVERSGLAEALEDWPDTPRVAEALGAVAS